MDNIKNNPIKYVKLFALLYLIVNVTLRIIYYAVTSAILSHAISFATIVGVIVSIVPILLFIVHIYKFYGTKKTQILLPVSYIVSIALSLFGLVQNIKNVRYINYYSSTAQALRYGVIDSIVNIIFTIIGLSLAVFLLVTCLNNFKTLKTAKKIILVNVAISLLSILIGIVLDIIAGYSLTVMFFISYLMSFSSILAHGAYVIFWNFAIEKRDISPLEYELLSLKELYENGSITEQVYNEKKAIILDKF